MLALLILVVTVGLADSLNPSTIGPALYLAARPGGWRSLACFVAGVFSVSTVVGLLLALGPGRALISRIHRPGGHTTSLIELAAGVAVVVLAVTLWFLRRRISRALARGSSRQNRKSFMLGAGIMAIELPTALPYFAVLTAVVASRRSAATDAMLILLFNGAFVAPLLATLAIRSLAGDSSRMLDRLRAKLDRHAGAFLAGLTLVVGAVLVGLGLRGLHRS